MSMTPLDRRIAIWEREEREYIALLKCPYLTPEKRHKTNLRRKEAARKVAELRHERRMKQQTDLTEPAGIRRFSPRAKASS